MTSFGQHYVVPAVGRYQERYPDVHIELTPARSARRGFRRVAHVRDLAVGSGLVSQRLSSACASLRYLERRGVLKTPADLANHSCLQMVTPVFPPDRWMFDGPNGEETVVLGAATFQVNVAEAMAVGVSSGMGIGLIPIYSAISRLRSGELVWLLPEYTF